MNEVFDQLRSAIYSVWHRRWLALAVAWGICVLGWLAVALIPNSYESRARIYVQLEDVLAEQIGIAGGKEEDITRVRQTLASATNLEKVIRATRLGEDIGTQREMDAAIESLSEKVEVKSEEDNLFELSATVGKGSLSDADNAKLSQDVVQKLIDIFREENIAGNRGEVAETVVFLDQQLEARKAELEAAEQRRLAFEAEHPELIGGSDAIASKIQTTRAELRAVEADLAAAQAALAAINGQLAGTPRTISSPGEVGGARAALQQAQAQLAALQAGGKTDNHPDVIAAKRQIALLRPQAAAEPSGVGQSPNPAYTSLVAIRSERQANVQSMQARKAALGAEVSSLMANQASEPAVAAEMTRISRDYDVLKTKYDELLQDREELQLRSQVESERSSFRFEVTDPPTVPRAPAAPNRPLLLLGVLFAGIAGGIGAAFVVGRLRSSFSTATSLERVMELPVLGTISMSLTDAAKAEQRRKLKLFAGGTAALGALFLVLLGIEFVQRGMVA